MTTSTVLLRPELVDRLDQQGWYVDWSEHQIDLHPKKANGQPYRTPSVSLSYWPTVEKDEWVGREHRVVHVESKRPWRVEGKGMARARTFANYFDARSLFLDRADELSRAWVAGNAAGPSDEAT